MKTRITTDDFGRVTVEYDDAIDGTRRSRFFSCPTDGGYVYEYFWNNGTTSQVCEGLSRSGSTLTCHSRDELVDLIRHEYRRMRRHEKQALGD